MAATNCSIEITKCEDIAVSESSSEDSKQQTCKSENETSSTKNKNKNFFLKIPQFLNKKISGSRSYDRLTDKTKSKDSVSNESSREKNLTLIRQSTDNTSAKATSGSKLEISKSISISSFFNFNKSKKSKDITPAVSTSELATNKEKEQQTATIATIPIKDSLNSEGNKNNLINCVIHFSFINIYLLKKNFFFLS